MTNRSSSFTQDCTKENKEYLVKKVFDGDTILVELPQQSDSTTVAMSQKIRLLGIDAFEHDQNVYGTRGKDFLTTLLLNKSVCVETDVQKNDIYGRTLGYVFIARKDEVLTKQSQSNLRKASEIATPHGVYREQSVAVRLAMTFINEELLKSGLAILYDFPPNIKYIDKLKKAQVFARENMLGVWEKRDYILETPSQWRQKH